MVKCFKLPVIQVCIAFDVFLRGSLRVKNRVFPRYKNSIFTIVKLVNWAGRNTKIEACSHLRVKCEQVANEPDYGLFAQKRLGKGVGRILKRGYPVITHDE